MKETLEKLWNEYLLDECAEMDTDEERKLTRNASELYEKVAELLNREQEDAVEKYVDALCDKGCEFAVSFLLETRNLEK